MLGKEDKPGNDKTKSAKPYISPANGTVLGAWPRRSKWSQNILGPEHHCPPRSFSRSLDCVKELQSHSSPFICSALATVDCHECAGEGKLFPVSSGIIGCSLWCLMWSCHWLKLAVPLAHWQPGAFVSSHNHCSSVVTCVTEEGFGMSGTVWAFYMSLTHLNPLFDWA